MVFFIQRANLLQKLHIRKHSGVFRPIKCNFMDFVPIYSGYACIRRYIWAHNTKAVRLDEKMARRGHRHYRHRCYPE